MGFNPNYTATKIITVPNPAAGALPATWSMFNNSQTPRDAAGYPVGGGHIWEVTTAVVAPIGYWNSDDISYATNGRYIRASASIRVSDFTVPGTGRGAAWVLLVVGTRAAGDPWGVVYGAGTDQNTYDFDFLRPGLPVSSLTCVLTCNQWHRFGIELLGRTINGYVDVTGYGAIADVPGDHALTYVGSVQAQEDTSDDISVGFSIAGSFALANYGGIGDILLEKLTPLAGGAGTANPGTDIPMTFTGSPIPYGGTPGVPSDGSIGGGAITDVSFDPSVPPWDPLQGFTISSRAYARYKTVRSAAQMLNNVTVQP